MGEKMHVCLCVDSAGRHKCWLEGLKPSTNRLPSPSFSPQTGVYTWWS